MYFEISGVTVDWWVPPLVALVVSSVTSMGGVSGAFLLLPFQMSFLGYTAPSVSATNQLFNIVAIPSGVYRYIREGRMVWPLTWVVILGTLPGVYIGAVLRKDYLPDPGSFKFFAGLVLFYIGARMVYDLLRKTQSMTRREAEARFQALVRNWRSRGEQGGEVLPGVCVEKFTLRRICYEFYGERYDFSTPGILALSFVVGIVGGTYGIGGGAIMAPFFVAVFQLPVYTVAGAALMGTFITSVAGVFIYWAKGMSPDWLLGLLFGLGGTCGMYLGARMQKFVPAKVIKWMLAVIIVSTAAKYILSYFGG
jgi:uncharacterized protein